jgi:prolyl-tRNA synthetase
MKDSSNSITKRSEDFSQWYLDVIDSADMAEHAPVRGCMIIKPYGYAIWENIQKVLDAKFKEKGVQNAYFPLLIPESFMTKEADHIEGFAPECATVTRVGSKKLEEDYIIRPTSETIIYDTFAKWLESYRDLPLLINQWCNVMRWELRPRLFLRTSEFLWQEGHTCHYTSEEADNFAREMLEVYKDFQQDFMATPVIAGEKTESERFAGALRTYTVEAMMQDGKAVQNGTSHFFGTGFASHFGVEFLDKDNQLKNPATTSWGVSTRMIGSLIMTHSDDLGLVLPPKIAPIQVVIVPFLSNKEDQNKEVLEKVNQIEIDLKKIGVATKLDKRDMRFGEKMFEWEKKGVPVRLEFGPKDMAKNQCVLARRDTGEKTVVNLDNLTQEVSDLLDKIQTNLFDRALKYQKEKTVEVTTWEEFTKAIEEGNFVVANYDGTKETEKKIKEELKATTRCIPFEIEQNVSGKCVYSGNEAKVRVIFGRSY